jgi:large subunit ribosomal protein L3
MIGLIGKKTGMTQVFDDTGRLIPVTVIEFAPNVVVGKKTADKDGYDAVVLGVYDKKKSRVTKPYGGQFPEGVSPTRILREMRDFEKEVAIGEKLGVAALEGLRFVDVSATSKGKGFQGVMKRYRFAGQCASHGTERKHRSPGAIGACATPSRVFKGMPMAGEMGNERVTVLNLEVVTVDAERNLLLISGSVPGSAGGYVFVRVSKTARVAKKA